MVAATLPVAFAPAGVKEPDSPEQWPFGTAEVKPGKVSPLEFLLNMVNNPDVDEKIRLQAAAIAAPFVHVKPVATKKEDAAEAAKKASEGRFAAPLTPPRLVVNR
jgi:phage terminase small subunit